QLFNRVRLAGDREIGDESPVDGIAVFGCATFPGMDDRQRQVAVTLLFADRWTLHQAVILDLQYGGRGLAFIVPHLNAMHGFDTLLGDRLHHGLFALTRPAIHAGAQYEVRSQGLALAE